MNIDIRKYNLSYKKLWDTFVCKSKNGTFLLYRDYIEYHGDRFNDHSLLFFSKNRLIAILPANLKEDKALVSHEGLTYAGLIMSTYTKVDHILSIFDELKVYLQSIHINRLIYKKAPYIYCKYPSDEDLYALFRHNATLVARAISSGISQSRIPYSDLRKRCINKSKKNSLHINVNTDFSGFWSILESNLKEKYNTKPTHSLREIEYLSRKFAQHITLYEIVDQNTLLAGCVVFKTNQVAHLQYISSTSEGRSIGALDNLIDYLIKESHEEGLFFDMGTSTLHNGYLLNEQLIFQKEGFGARGIIYDTYELTI